MKITACFAYFQRLARSVEVRVEPEASLAETEGSSAQTITDQKPRRRGQECQDECLEQGQRAVRQTLPFDLAANLNAGSTSFVNLGKFADARLKIPAEICRSYYGPTSHEPDLPPCRAHNSRERTPTDLSIVSIASRIRSSRNRLPMT